MLVSALGRGVRTNTPLSSERGASEADPAHLSVGPHNCERRSGKRTHLGALHALESGR